MKFLKTIPILLFCCFTFSYAAEFSANRAEKVSIFLKKIAKRTKKTVILKQATFSEQDLNSYLNIVYTRKYAPEVKYLKLYLDNDNVISGIMKVKLIGKKYDKVPSFLKDFEIEFSGQLECRNYRIRYIFEKIKINGTSFSPEILDEAFSAGQAGIKEPKSIFDWFNFLPGIKKVQVRDKRITFFY